MTDTTDTATRAAAALTAATVQEFATAASFKLGAAEVIVTKTMEENPEKLAGMVEKLARANMAAGMGAADAMLAASRRLGRELGESFAKAAEGVSGWDACRA